MKTYRTWLFFLAISIGILSCRTGEQSPQAVQPGIDLSMMDTTASPTADFYRFANGAWLDNTEIPGDQGRWSSFNELRKRTDRNVLEVLTGALEGDTYQTGSDQAKAATFFKTAMDTTHINQVGLTPLQPEFEKIEVIGNTADLQKYLIESAPMQHGAFFGMGVFANINNSEINGAYLGAGALGLPDRDYYTKEDEDSQKLQEQYRQHVARMMKFIGYDEDKAQRASSEIYRLEKRMAQSMLTNVEQRNPTLMNNPRSVADLQQMVPSINWAGYLSGIGAGSVDTLIVTQTKYMAELENILKEEDLSVIKEYVKWTQLNNWANYLNKDIEQTNFDFYGKVLQGVQEMRPRDERVLGVANARIGEAIGKLYVDAYFPPEAKQVAQEMVDNILAAMKGRIEQLEWMSDTTKSKALEKLSTFKVKIGYPDEWTDYSELNVKGAEEGGSYVENMINASIWNWRRDLDKIGKEVDKKEWGMAPQIVNAYYNPLNNEIVFPAAILQPPFFNFQADPAVNYGGIGAVIGHEISHGFDDQGSRFDAQGNLKNWWTDGDRERFDARAQKLIDQFSAYEPLEGVNVNGAFTLGENIGDLGGVNVAFDGLQRHLAEFGDPGPIDGFNQAQRFFISWATIWRTKYRDEFLKTQVNTDPHSPGMYRAIGPLVNVDAFYEAFNIREEDPLYKPENERVRIW